MFRSKAPLRIGLAGGGTDVSPYADLHGGAILNATISLYAYASIQLIPEKKIIIEALDRSEEQIHPLQAELPIDGTLDLAKGVYNSIVRRYNPELHGFRLSSFVEAPAGSGLGTSSTLVVTILGAFSEWLKLPLGDYDTAHYAYEIERYDLKMAGGRQDQYAATFGGVNFMEFYADDKVIVNPLRIRPEYLHELGHNLLLYYTSTSRLSSDIIESQSRNVVNKNEKSIEAMHHLKDQARMMKEALLRGRVDEMGEILDYGFQHKKQMTQGITNPLIDEMYETARKAGATGGKISGAGGGGFMTFYCPDNTRYAVMKAMKKFDGYFKPYQFVDHGLITWSPNGK